ncbi:hypothetical protein [Caldivirga sp.]|uniref:hypothetical protein n=1 Tax=Caldivirga sp. TaxID=2080243 RepID=UPI003D132FAE
MLSEGERKAGELEYVRRTKYHVENINGVEVTSFEVPYIRYFAEDELVYLEAVLDFKNTDELIKRIDESKLGRKTIEKVFAYRLKQGDAGPEPWPVEPALLPSLIQNNAEPNPVYEVKPDEGLNELVSSAYGLNRFMFSYSIRINDIKDFLFMGVLNKGFYKEVYIMRSIEPMAIVKYNVYV